MFVPVMFPSIPVTMLIRPNQNEMVDLASNNPKQLPKFCDATVDVQLMTEPLCQCLRNGIGDDAHTQCFVDHHGAPAEQKLYSWFNLNFILFHIFFVSSIYQFVLRNAFDVDISYRGRDVQSAIAVCGISLITLAILSLFNFKHGANLFSLIMFMPHQLILFMIGLLGYYNIFVEKLSEEMQIKYKNAIFSGLYKASIIPFMGIFIASIQSWTTLEMIQFIYNILFCLCIADLAYLMLNIDVNGDLDRVAARIRVKQATFLIVMSCLVAYSLTTLVYMPIHSDFIMFAVSIAFLALLWVQHVFLDAAHAIFRSREYDRVFFIGDALLAMVRFLLFIFSIWLVHFKSVEHVETVSSK
jgi:hypothetical protein